MPWSDTDTQITSQKDIQIGQAHNQVGGTYWKKRRYIRTISVEGKLLTFSFWSRRAVWMHRPVSNRTKAKIDESSQSQGVSSNPSPD